MAASARRSRTRILRLMPLALPTSNSRFGSIARLQDTIHACSWRCLASKGLTFVVAAASVRSTQSRHVLRTQFAYRRQPRRHRFQLEPVTIYLRACHVNAEVCYSAFAPHHHAVILGFANHSVRLPTLCCRRLSAVIPRLKLDQHRCCHTFDAPLCVSLGTRCCYISVNFALDVPVLQPRRTLLYGHSLLEPRLVSGIPGTTVHSRLHQDWSAVTGAFMFLPIGGA
jgi:hypothetical protein